MYDAQGGGGVRVGRSCRYKLKTNDSYLRTNVFRCIQNEIARPTTLQTSSGSLSY